MRTPANPCMRIEASSLWVTREIVISLDDQPSNVRGSQHRWEKLLPVNDSQIEADGEICDSENVVSFSAYLVGQRHHDIRCLCGGKLALPARPNSPDARM